MTHTPGPGECFSLANPVSRQVTEPTKCNSITVQAESHSTTERIRKSRTENNLTVSKIYKATTRFSYSMPKKDIFCFDDSNAYGEYFSLDLNLWEELNYSIDEHKRINVSRQHAGKEIRLFIQTDENGEFKTVDNIIMFSRSEWSELRRVRGENRGLPLEVNANGTIWIGDRAETWRMKIFIRRD